MTPEAAQIALGVDAWGLNQLVALGEFAQALDERNVNGWPSSAAGSARRR